jgi:hypothetical protein
VVNLNMDCTMKSVEIGGDSGNSGGAGLLNGEKEYDPISINGSLDGVILENLDDNVEELAKENLGWRRVEKAAKPVMRSSGSISDSEGIGVLPHFVKEKDGVSDTEILKPKLRSSMNYAVPHRLLASLNGLINVRQPAVLELSRSRFLED